MYDGVFSIDKLDDQKSIMRERENSKWLISNELNSNLSFIFFLFTLSSLNREYNPLPSKPAKASESTYVIWFPSNSSEFN